MNGTHCMLDFETLGQRPTTAVISLGAVIFNSEKILAQKDWTFDVKHQLENGRTIDYSTLQWWMKQSDSARAVFQRTVTTKLSVFAEEFKQFLGGPKVKIWGNGADFDVSIIADIFQRSLRIDLPWIFWDVRCFRTFNAIHDCKKLVVRKGTHHNALDDAIYQAECVIAALNKKTQPNLL